MPTPRKDRVTAHVKRIVQDNERILVVAMSESQLLELVQVATVALREQKHHKDGYRLAMWKYKVNKCEANPPCEGGRARITFVRPGEKTEAENG